MFTQKNSSTTCNVDEDLMLLNEYQAPGARATSPASTTEGTMPPKAARHA